jgi:hypothetical protein
VVDRLKALVTMYGGMGGGGNAWMKIMGIGDQKKRKKER